MPLIETKGAASSQGVGQFARASGPAVYVEDVFSTWLYTGTGASQTITNGINLSTNGGLVWIKDRSVTTSHFLSDTAQGVNKWLASNGSGGQTSIANWGISSFNTNGFSLVSAFGDINTSGDSYASWTFRKQPKFFDVVTYTGNGASQREIAHNLGSAPGCVITKRIDSAEDWYVTHRKDDTGIGVGLYLNQNVGQQITGFFPIGNATTFKVGNQSSWYSNTNGASYVAYIFAHNAGGFGLSGTDNAISCGSYTGNGSTSGPVITLGYEPQWILVKNSSSGTFENWHIVDSMRGLPVNGPAAFLNPNNANSEATSNPFIDISATGFRPVVASSRVNTNGNTYIYIAIRRGPMKVPTSGTSVFEPVAATQGLNDSTPANSSILDDAFISSGRTTATVQFNVGDRLRGSPFFFTQGASAETSGKYSWARQTGVAFTANLTTSGSLIMYHFRRAPGFFDVVCYTGTGTQTTISHNLAAVPELLIIKTRNANGPNWMTYTFSTGVSNFLTLNQSSSTTADNLLWVSTPTSTVFTIPGSAPLYDSYINASGSLYVAYLFASCPGVSKVGSYTGTGTTQQINCGFTGGARFVLIKRTDSTGDWYVWDTARGIVAGNDPYLLLNSTAAEVTSTDYIDTLSTGFEISSTAPAAINANGGSFIYLAIA